MGRGQNGTRNEGQDWTGDGVGQDWTGRGDGTGHGFGREGMERDGTGGTGRDAT